jgi:hypothetical protein
MAATLTQDITAPSREERLLPSPKTAQPRKRRFGAVTFGLLVTLGLGVAGGANLHRLVDLNESATWLPQTETILQSGFEAARHEIGNRIVSFTSRPVSVAQASQEAVSVVPNNGEAIERAVADLSLRVDQFRAANEVSARDLRSAAEQNHRELVAKLAQLTERVDRVEHQAAAATAPVATQPVITPPVVQPTPILPPPISPPPRPTAKPVANPVTQLPTPSPTKPVATPAPPATPDTKAKVVPKQTSTEMKPGMDVKGIANWTVRDAIDGKAVLEGPRGTIKVAVGDTIPEIGRVQGIMRSGRRWIVATTKGVITPH